MASSGDSNQRPAPVPGLPQPTFNTLQFGTMSDSQLRQTINQLSHAASGAQYQPYAAPTPQRTTGEPDHLHSFHFFLSFLFHLSLLFTTAFSCSLPEKYRKLVDIFNPSPTHGVTTQPPSKKQQSCTHTCSCPRHPHPRRHPTHSTSRVSTTTITSHDGRVAAPSPERPTQRQTARPTPNNSTGASIDLRLALANGRDAPRAARPLRLVYRRRSRAISDDLNAPETWRRRELR